MTVAPELPPVPVARRAGSRRRLRAVVVDRTPAGVVALVEPRAAARTVAPSPPGGRAGRAGGAGDRPGAPPGRVPPRLAWPLARRPRSGLAGAPRPAGGARPVAPGRRRVVSRPWHGWCVRAGHLGYPRGRRGRGAHRRAHAGRGGVPGRRAAGSAPVPASAPAQVVVAPGETLWSIAERVAPHTRPAHGRRRHPLAQRPVHAPTSTPARPCCSGRPDDRPAPRPRRSRRARVARPATPASSSSPTHARRSCSAATAIGPTRSAFSCASSPRLVRVPGRALGRVLGRVGRAAAGRRPGPRPCPRPGLACRYGRPAAAVAVVRPARGTAGRPCQAAGARATRSAARAGR